MRQILKKIQNFSFFEKSVKHKLKKRFTKRFLNKNIELLIYEKKIVIVSIFLFISSSFLYKNKKEKYFYFDWKSYLRIFSHKQFDNFIICGIKYLYEANMIIKNKEEIEPTIPNIQKTFKEEYQYLLMQKNSSIREVNKDFDFDKFLLLIEQSISIYELRQKKIKKDPSSVLNLISTTCMWKQKMFEIFGNKSEYIVYNFFLNLDV